MTDDTTNIMSAKKKNEITEIIFYFSLSSLIMSGYKFIYDLGILDGSLNVAIDAIVIIVSVIGIVIVCNFIPWENKI